MISLRKCLGIGMMVLAALVCAGLLRAQGVVDTRRQVAGFYWVYDDGTGPGKSVSQNADAITTLCPTWMEVLDADANLSVHTDAKLVALAKQKGIRIIPLIANAGFKPKPFHWILVSPTRREKLITRIIEVLDGLGYCQGINLDIEGLYPKDRALYSEFLSVLSDRLHAKNYQVTIDIPCKTRDVPNAEWSGAFDYVEIAKSCDQVMIMTYDEHWPGGDPGPIAGAEFDDKCMQYATTVIPKEKILMGIPFYGYDWWTKGHAGGVFYTGAIRRAAQNKAKIQWDEASKCPWFTYTDAKGRARTCWFENKESLAAKLEVARKNDVAGICIWSLGDEDPGCWDVIRRWQQ